MKAYLMHPDRDFAVEAKLPRQAETLIQDLELGAVFEAMGAGDEYLRTLAKTGLLSSLTDPLTIRYRQHVLTDCLERPDVVRRTYALAVEALEAERKIWGWSTLRRSPDGTLHRSLEVMRLFLPLLRRLRGIAAQEAARFTSSGFARFWRMLRDELSDEYLRVVEDHLSRLTFPRGLSLSAELGAGNKGTGYVLHEPPAAPSWRDRLARWRGYWFERTPRAYTYEVAPRDEAGHQALADLQRRGIARTAAALACSADHVLRFFGLLRAELGFYVGCLNLHDRLSARSHPVCLPEALDSGQTTFSAQGLYDVALALRLGGGVVANSIRADHQLLVMITGANRGGKSTVLRSVGQAQLMLQCGMFVPAAALSANVCPSIFTHFKREEDETLRSGKLDEELKRMSAIVDQIEARSMLLCNESFGSTHEREGAEIARQILRAMLESEIKVFYVTHLFDLAEGFCRQQSPTALFLRAQRLPDGRRTFLLEPADPLPTSFGQDLYRKIFDGETSTRSGSPVDAMD